MTAPLAEPIFCLDERKKRWYLRVFQKIEDRDVKKTPVNKCFCHFRGLKLWYLGGFLSSDSTKCCKLQNFARCLCSIFKRAMLSHVLCILPQETTLLVETGRRHDPKESWTEETHRSFYTHRGFYTEKSLQYTKEFFTHRRFYTEKSLL